MHCIVYLVLSTTYIIICSILVLLHFFIKQRPLQDFKPGTLTLIEQVYKMGFYLNSELPKLSALVPNQLFLFNMRSSQTHI